MGIVTVVSGLHESSNCGHAEAKSGNLEMELEHLQQDKQHDGCKCVNLDLYGLVEQMEIYIWVNYNISLT